MLLIIYLLGIFISGYIFLLLANKRKEFLPSGLALFLSLIWPASLPLILTYQLWEISVGLIDKFKKHKGWK